MAQHVRSKVNCYDCGKPRCIYAKKDLTNNQSRNLRLVLQKHDYSCGAMITTEGMCCVGLNLVHTTSRSNSQLG